MAYFSYEALQRNMLIRKTERFSKTAASILTESAVPSSLKKYDIFLSHSYKDADFVLQLKTEIEGLGYSVYVDWINDPQLDRTHVNEKTAETLRGRVKYCQCLLYAHTPSSGTSVWMPWELGLADGYTGKVAILPVVKSNEQYTSQEYLGIYPKAELLRAQSGKDFIWVIKNGKPLELNYWISI